MKNLRKYIREQLLNVIKEDDDAGEFVSQVDISGIEGWIAQRFDSTQPGNDGVYDKWWAIYDESKMWRGAIYDDGKLSYYDVNVPQSMSFLPRMEKEINKSEFVNNPIQAARYIWLKSQEPNT